MQQHYTITATDTATGKELARTEDVPADAVDDIVAIMAHGIAFIIKDGQEVKFEKRTGDLKWEVKL